MQTLKSYKFITTTVITFKHFLEQVNNLSPLVFIGIIVPFIGIGKKWAFT